MSGDARRYGVTKTYTGWTITKYKESKCMDIRYFDGDDFLTTRPQTN